MYQASNLDDLNNFLKSTNYNLNKSNTDIFLKKYINYDKDSVESVMLLINDLILIKWEVFLFLFIQTIGS